MTPFAPQGAPRRKVQQWRGVRIGTAILAVLALLAAGCTSGESITPGPSTPVTSSDGSPPASGASDEPDGSAGSGTADGSEGSSGGSNGIAPTLAPPAAPPGGHLWSGDESSEALAAMPGLYGLSMMHTVVLDDRIEIEAPGDCATVVEVLQSGQWTVSAQADGDEIALALTLGDQSTHGHLAEGEDRCTGTLFLPAQ